MRGLYIVHGFQWNSQRVRETTRRSSEFRTPVNGENFKSLALKPLSIKEIWETVKPTTFGGDLVLSYESRSHIPVSRGSAHS